MLQRNSLVPPHCFFRNSSSKSPGSPCSSDSPAFLNVPFLMAVQHSLLDPTGCSQTNCEVSRRYQHPEIILSHLFCHHPDQMPKDHSSCSGESHFSYLRLPICAKVFPRCLKANNQKYRHFQQYLTKNSESSVLLQTLP